MNLDELILALQNAKEPDRNLDEGIATFSGYQKAPEENGENEKTAWLTPVGTPAELPFYTMLVEDALAFTTFAAPDHIGGISWGLGAGKATINGNETAEAANPAIALCIAALRILRLRQK